MARKTIFDNAFDELWTDFKPLSKKGRFLADIRAQLEEDEEINELVRKRRSAQIQYMAVSFDRKLNDATFSYGDFDLALVALDAIAGGKGIRKPVNQMRVLRWNSTRTNLRRVLMYLARMNPQLKTKSLLILPFPEPVVGRGVLTTIYKS